MILSLTIILFSPHLMFIRDGDSLVRVPQPGQPVGDHLGPPLPPVLDLGADILIHSQHPSLQAGLLLRLPQGGLHRTLPPVNVTLGRGPVMRPSVEDIFIRLQQEFKK